MADGGEPILHQLAGRGAPASHRLLLHGCGRELAHGWLRHQAAGGHLPAPHRCCPGGRRGLGTGRLGGEQPRVGDGIPLGTFRSSVRVFVGLGAQACWDPNTHPQYTVCSPGAPRTHKWSYSGSCPKSLEDSSWIPFRDHCYTFHMEITLGQKDAMKRCQKGVEGLRWWRGMTRPWNGRGRAPEGPCGAP